MTSDVLLRPRPGPAHPHLYWMMEIEYGARFDHDGWMVVDTAVVSGELTGEAVRRDLSFREAAQLAAILNRHGRYPHANQN